MYNQLDSAKIHKLVVWKIDLKIVNALGRSALHITIEANNFSMIEALFECHIDISIRNKEDDTTRSYLDKTKCSTNINFKSQILQLLDK
jgi:hypothetical protein